jgi:hypothetical protein
LGEDVRNKTIVDIWNEVKEEEEVEAEAFEFLASQVEIDRFHQKMCDIQGTKMKHNKR